MIRTTLEFLKKELESYIVNREQDPANYNIGGVVDISPVVLPNGEYNLNNATHISIMLVGIEEEKREGKRPHFLTTDDDQFKQLSPPIELDLQLLFIANNSDYTTALRDLSSVVSFFQVNSVFSESKYPGLNASVVNQASKPWQLIERLSLRLNSMTFEKQNNLWAMLGGKYIPSAVYHASMLTMFESKSDMAAPAITETNYNN